MAGMAVGLHTLDLEFLPYKPYTGCRICGRVYQSSLDRAHPWNDLPEQTALTQAFMAKQRRRAWAEKHSKTHTSTQHRQLAESGAWCTPEAAHILAAYGVIPVTDMIMSNDHSVALHESKAVPVNDVEGVRY